MVFQLFRLCKDDSGSISPSSKLHQAFEKLEKKEIVLQKKIAAEIERAKEFTKAKNKPAALQCLMRKKFYEEQIEHLGSFQLLIHNKELMLQKKYSLNGSQLQGITSNINGNFKNTSTHTSHSTLK